MLDQTQPIQPARPLIGFEGSLSDPGVLLLLEINAGILIVALAVVGALALSGRLRPELRAELVKRTLAWCVMAPIVALPILLGKLPTILLFTILSLLCYREFSRATGLFREKTMSAIVVIAILALNFAALDNWYDLFVAVPGISIVIIAAAAILRDKPRGYLQRVSLAALSMLLFGLCLGHLGYMANDADYRRPMLLLLMCVGLNDVYAYCVGRTIKGPKLAPSTSPGKTLSGAVGAMVLTTLTVWLVGRHVLYTNLSETHHLIAIGILLSLGGILGDLTISSVKRDVGIKDMGALIPGHGGVLDRCNSLLLAAPALFHYIGYFHGGFGLDQPIRIITGPLFGAR
ncbi:MAG TPA: phosphatidate cytidylyltransferase [Phycisphaerales bacterium]|nr:phosphatidate cytidylyltransferase [Phycisphaerales bacterium]